MLWRVLLALALLSSVADAQPVLVPWRPPACTTGQVMKHNGTTWACATDAGGFDTAGDGLTSSSSTLNVGCGVNMTCNANDVALSTSVTGLSLLSSQEVDFSPVQAWGGGEFANLDTLEIDDYAPTGLQTSTLIVTRGADNEGTRITGIDSTGINPGDLRIFVNLPYGATPPTDSGTITFVHESTDSLAANRIQTPGATDCTFPMYSVVPLIYGGVDGEGNHRWRLFGSCGWGFQSKVQRLSFYPMCQTSSGETGTFNNYRPTCTTLMTAGYTLAGGLTDSYDHTVLRVNTHADGATLTGLYTGAPVQSDELAHGPVKIIQNVGTGTLTLKNQNAGSNESNRFKLPRARDLILRPNESVILHSPFNKNDDLAAGWEVAAIGASNEDFPSIHTDGSTDLGGLLAFNSIETPSALSSGVTDDYDPGSREIVWRLTGHADGSQLTGIVAPALNVAEVHLIVNIGSGPLALVDDDGAASTDGNRFELDAPAAVIPANGQRWVWYDITTARWRVASTGADARLSIPHALTTASVTGTQNNYAPTDCKYASVIRLDQSGDVTLTGLSCGQATGDIKILRAGASNTLTLNNLDSGSSVGNRFRLPRGLAATVGSSGAFVVRYNASDQTWDLVASTGPHNPVQFSSSIANSGLRFTDTNGTVSTMAITDNGTSAMTLASGRTLTIAGSTTFSSTASATGGLFAIQTPAWSNRLVPTALTSGSTTDNWNPTNWATFEHIAVTTSAGSLATLSGMTAGSNGQLKTLCNFGSGAVKLLNENSGSSASNRLSLAEGVDATLPDNATGRIACVFFRYDSSQTRWEELARNFDGTNPSPITTSDLSSCGTTPALGTGATNESFTLTTGTGATACTITFQNGGYTNAPTCTVSAESGTQPAYTTSTTALTMSTAAASAVYHVICRGH